MKTVKVSIEETFKYRRQMIISVPDSMTEKELDRLLGKTERKAEQASDAPYAIKELNPEIIVVEFPNEDLDSPDFMSMEIDDFDIVE